MGLGMRRDLTSWRRRVVYFFVHNWGAAFVIIFILLILASTTYLNYGEISSANLLGIYAFYFLVIGIALQITSSIAYGSQVDSVDSNGNFRKTESTLKFRLIAAVSIIIIIAVGIVAFNVGNPLNSTGLSYSQPTTLTKTR